MAKPSIYRTIRGICTTLSATYLLFAASPLAAHETYRYLPLDEYKDKVYASWLGQMIGNFYGLSYEFKYIDQPGPDSFPYGYGPTLERVKQANGAFSDDDTDIEYMYLLQMEEHGIEPTYAQLAEAWKYHVQERVWAANRQALTLMHAGYSPPLTGYKNLNSEWFQIDPQLVNEIWALTAPGMLDYATQKTAWAARITNDSFGIEPAIHYAAMYSAAFFESDIDKLIEIGTKALPEGSRFADTVRHMQKLYQQYPDDWQAARKEMADSYARVFDYNPNSWVAIDANLNGDCAILALLYGQGDFQQTLDMSSALGFDADNQAATLAGLLGIIKGLEGIPDNLLYPLGKDIWEKPFNDKYVNVSRHDLPDASIEDMAIRLAEQGKQVTLSQGGKLIERQGKPVLAIPHHNRFSVPAELAATAPLSAQLNQAFSFNFAPHALAGAPPLRLLQGDLPEGLAIAGYTLSGTPQQTGKFSFTLGTRKGGKLVQQQYQLSVHTPNLAEQASEVIGPEAASGSVGLEVIRDGKRGLQNGLEGGKTFYAKASTVPGQTNHYGYHWDKPQDISTLVFNPGYTREFSGWFTSLQVEYLNNDGVWQKVDALNIAPQMNFANSQYLKGKYIDHTLRFKTVRSKGIRIIGVAGGVAEDGNPKKKQFYTSISELSVHQY